MVQKKQIMEAVNLLTDAADAKKVILFGSYARGDHKSGSDVDLLVIEESVVDRALEMVRLRRVLSPLRIPVDVVVVSEKVFQKWSDTPGNMLFEAATEGKVLYEAA